MEDHSILLSRLLQKEKFLTCDTNDRLRFPRRNGHPRLHPRSGPSPGPPGRPELPAREQARRPSVEPGLRSRQHGHRDHQGVQQGGRPGPALRGQGAPTGRRPGPDGQPDPRERGAQVEDGAHDGEGLRGPVEMGVEQPQGLPPGAPRGAAGWLEG